ncbi:hypothetical protein LPB72_02975 [Hydrogenophaga crassostreae]|uniref:DUF202 domain-containing protein n=2 Tax=Hydrogenophaga crassostreae TaxID=1763535 RepID=A0A162Z3L6_9BURK|nr:DUF202 domain-containing protein [Hydrogenophaga crassostreae]AOW14454.1 hypothetical protein LPB072_18060 [Hydrogenophaga crassostreae]OAD43523.1 hypothetical protein LPB72_02975 [Hydrogenophaga crassostreae]
MSAAIAPGLQPQRTALSWRRTGMAFLVCGALILRSGIEHSQLALDALGVLLLLTTAAVAVFGHRRERALLERGCPCAPPFLAIALIAGQTALAGVGGLACVYLSMG